MYVVLVLLLVGLMAMVVVSLVRGIIAFLQSTKEDLDHPGGTGPTPSQLKQQQMMKNRIMFQAMAIGVVALLLAVAGGHH
ncbi:HIG1 domain-containing protein [Novosphingobium sp. ZN18A2]|uniref:hypothetical protein n=1 Tax=Novosphingobium sp. ZN18A2 TaxID=3079861 RepID=UPI0030CC7413